MDPFDIITKIAVSMLTAIIVPTILSYKRTILQFRFVKKLENKIKTTVLIIRNTSKEPVYIDKILLYKTYMHHKDMSEKCNISLEGQLLQPSEKIQIDFSEDEIKTIFEEMCNVCDLSKNLHRLGLKFVIYCSAGILTTSWFKFGFEKESKHWIEYDFLHYHRHYYNSKRRLFVDMIGFRYISFGILLMLSMISIINFIYDGKIEYFLGPYFISLLLAVIISMDGHKKRRYVWIYSLLSTIPIALMIFYYMDPLFNQLVFSVFMFAIDNMALIRLSGWDL